MFLLGTETNQELIMAEGGIGLLARTADDAKNPQTLRMFVGAIANLCGNGNLIDPPSTELDLWKSISRTNKYIYTSLSFVRFLHLLPDFESLAFYESLWSM
jgi:hypothetical protein